MTTFNTGFMCPKCGPVQECTRVTKRKVTRDCCKVCDSPVVKWSRPLNERAGRCRHCANASFHSRIHLSIFMRTCNKCDEVVNPDNGEVFTPGKEEMKYANE